MNKIKLFCIPHAGGSASIYYQWRPQLGRNIELVPVELAGRGRRHGENFYKNWEHGVEDIYHSIVTQTNGQRYAIFGHSMGCLMAFDVLERLQSNGFPEPEAMFFSGNLPPHLDGIEERISKLPDQQFIEKLLATGDTPQEIFEDAELKEIFLPVLRNDYYLVESYKHRERKVKYTGSMHVLNGARDKIMHREVEQWRQYADSDCQIHVFKGGHMFINENKSEVVGLINKLFSHNPYLIRR